MVSTAQDVLGTILKDGIDIHRCAAARAIGRIAAPGASECLTEALLDEDPDVRTDAAEALRGLNDPAAADALMESLLGDPEPDVKKAALAALITMRHPALPELLRKLALSRSDEVVWDEDEFYAEGWDSWLDIQLLAIDGLAELGTTAGVMDVLSAMSDEMGQDVSESGVAALARMGAVGAEALVELFTIDDPQLHRRIAEAAVRSENPHIAPLVARMLSDESAQIRRIAARGIEASDPRLEPLFADPDGAVRAAVVAHAGERFPAQVAELVNDPEAPVRAAVFRVMAACPELFPGKELSQSVQQAISGDPGPAREAALALVALRGPSAAKGLAHTMTNANVPLDFRVGAVDAMRQAGPISVPYLVSAIADKERRLRLAAMTALAGFAADDPVWPNAAGEALLAAMSGELVPPPEQDGDEEAAQEEATHEEAAPAAATENPAAIAEDEREIEATMPLVPEPAQAGGSTLDRIVSGGDAATAVEPAQADAIELSEEEERLLDLSRHRKLSKRRMSLDADVVPHLDVRRFAASLLGEVVNADVTDRLIAVLEDEAAAMDEEALGSLVQHGERKGALPAAAFAPLSRLLTAEKPETRALAIRALARVDDPGVEEILRTYLSDDDSLLRVEAVRGLDHRRIAGPEVEACLDDDYLGVGIAAARCLARNAGDGAVDALVAFAFRHDGVYRQEIGKLLGTYARDAGARRLIEILGDDTYRRDWLVAIDALAEVLSGHELPPERKVA